MRAVRFHGKKDIRLDEIPEPPIEPGKVKIKPAFTGICGSDLHEYLDGATIVPTTTPHPITGETAPVTMGHEFSGVVEEVGEGVIGFNPGDRVCVQPIIYDSECGACQMGQINSCFQGGFIGLSGWGGGLSDHVVVPAESVFQLGPKIPLDVGGKSRSLLFVRLLTETGKALVEPLAVAWHAVKNSPFTESSNILVLGGGPIGLAVLQVLKARKALKVIVAEVSNRRKEFATQFGADYVLDPSKDDVVKKSKELCGGVATDIVFDTAGNQASIDLAIASCRGNGMIINIALWAGKGVTIRPDELVWGEKAYRGSLTYVKGDFKEVIQAVSDGVLQPAGMITSKIGMHEVAEKGFRALVEEKDKHVKILIEVNPEQK